MYDGGKMDGANLISCAPAADCPPNAHPNPQYHYVIPSDVAPYFAMAEQYTFGEVPVRHLPRRVGRSKVAASSVIGKTAAQQFIALLRVWREFHRGPSARAPTLVATAEPAER